MHKGRKHDEKLPWYHPDSKYRQEARLRSRSAQSGLISQAEYGIREREAQNYYRSGLGKKDKRTTLQATAKKKNIGSENRLYSTQIAAVKDTDPEGIDKESLSVGQSQTTGFAGGKKRRDQASKKYFMRRG